MTYLNRELDQITTPAVWQARCRQRIRRRRAARRIAALAACMTLVVSVGAWAALRRPSAAPAAQGYAVIEPVKITGGGEGGRDGESSMATGWRWETADAGQSGTYPSYRYEPLDGSGVADILADYFRTAHPGLAVTLEPSPDGDGTVFCTMRADDGFERSFSLGADTGKFCISAQPTEQTLRQLAVDYASFDLAAREPELAQTAQAFAALFADYTGPVTLARSEWMEFTYYLDGDGQPNQIEQLRVQGCRFYFSGTGEPSEPVYSDAPLFTGFSEDDDAGFGGQAHLFCVDVLPDGTVTCAYNPLTTAAIVPGETQTLDAEAAAQLLTDGTVSDVPDDTVVIRSLSVTGYEGFLTASAIEPLVHIEYYLESDPEQVYTWDVQLPELNAMLRPEE